MSETTTFHAVIDSIDEDIAVLSVEPVGSLKLPVDCLPSEAEEGMRLHFEVTIGAEGTQYMKKDTRKLVDDAEEVEEEAYEFSDETA